MFLEGRCEEAVCYQECSFLAIQDILYLDMKQPNQCYCRQELKKWLLYWWAVRFYLFNYENNFATLNTVPVPDCNISNIKS